MMKLLVLIALVAAASAKMSRDSIKVTRLDQSRNPVDPMSHFEVRAAFFLFVPFFFSLTTRFQCSACISFINEALNDLIQIIAQVGIGGGCSKVCGLLPSSTLATICDIVCEIAGIEVSPRSSDLRFVFAHIVFAL